MGTYGPRLSFAFNEIPDTKPGLPTGCLCPPPDRATLEARTRSGTMFCYRESPAMTPLVRVCSYSTIRCKAYFAVSPIICSFFRRSSRHSNTRQELDEQLDPRDGPLRYATDPSDESGSATLRECEIGLA